MYLLTARLLAAGQPPVAGTAGTPSTAPLFNMDPATPNNTMPGVAFLKEVAQGIGTWALIASIAGIFIGAIIWALGSYSQNYQQSYNGRKGVLVSMLAALLVGAGPYLVSFFFAQGAGIHG